MTAGAFRATSKNNDELAVFKMLVNAGPSTSSTCCEGSYSMSLVLSSYKYSNINKYQLVLSPDLMDFLVYALESCTDGYALSGLYFVSSEHPYLDPAHSQRLYRGRDLVL